MFRERHKYLQGSVLSAVVSIHWGLEMHPLWIRRPPRMTITQIKRTVSISNSDCVRALKVWPWIKHLTSLNLFLLPLSGNEFCEDGMQTHFQKLFVSSRMRTKSSPLGPWFSITPGHAQLLSGLKHRGFLMYVGCPLSVICWAQNSLVPLIYLFLHFPDFRFWSLIEELPSLEELFAQWGVASAGAKK